MKRRLLSLLLCIMMIMSMIPTNIFAAQDAQLYADVDASEHTDHEGWTAWESTTALPSEAGKYYLTADVMLSSNVILADGLELCLNGHAISYNSSSSPSYVLCVNENTEVTLCNCNESTTHYFTPNTSYGYWSYNSDGTQTDSYVNGALLTTSINYPRGYLKVYGTLNISDINIVGVRMDYYNYPMIEVRETGVLNLKDTTVMHNQTAYVCSAYAEGAALNLAGKVVIKDNVNSSSYFTNRELIVYPDFNYVNITEPLAEGSEITLSTDEAPHENAAMNVTGANAADYSSYFVGDPVYNTYYNAVNGQNNEVLLAAKPGYDVSVATNLAEAGNVSGGGFVLSGENVTIRATTHAGYKFEGWYEGDTLISTSSTYTVQNITSSKTFTAHYSALVGYAISVTAQEGGTAVGDSGYEGNTLTAYAIPDGDHIFEGWYEDGSLVSDTAFFKVTGIDRNYNLIAKFTDVSSLDGHTDHSGWTSWSNSKTLPTQSGKYYLDTDVVLSDVWVTPNNVILCLNDHVITFSEKYSNTGVSAMDGASVALFDCGDTRRYYEIDNKGLWILDEDYTTSTRYTDGGIITCATTAVYMNKNYSHLRIFDVNFVGNHLSYNDYTGAIVLTGTRITAYIKDANIVGNVSYTPYWAYYCCGGGIYAGSGVDKLSLSGDTTISYNRAKDGAGGVYAANGTLEVSDSVRVEKNIDSYGVERNISCKEITVIAPLTEQARIGLYNEDGYSSYFTTASDANYIDNFYSDLVGYYLENSSNNRIIVRPSKTSTQYIVSAGILGGGTTTVNGASNSALVDEGSSAVLVATPEEDYEFMGWYTYDNDVDDDVLLSSQPSYTVTNVTKDVSYKAKFERQDGFNPRHTSHTGWTAWESSSTLPTTSGKYYLTTDVLLTSGNISLPDGLEICLNGHVISAGYSSSSRPGYTMKVESGVRVCFSNCNTSTTHYFTGSSETGLWKYDSTLTDGEYSVSGGVITQDKSKSNYYYSPFYVEGVLDIQDISMVGLYPYSTGGVVYIDGLGTVKMKNVDIHNNNNDYTVQAEAGSRLKLSGKVNISNDGQGSGIHVLEDVVYMQIVDGLDEGSNIWLANSVTPIEGNSFPVTGANAADYSQYFASSDLNYVVTNGEDNAVMLSVADGSTITLEREVNEGDVAYAGTVSGGGYVRLGESVSMKATVKDGYTFDGWYYDGECVSTELSYTAQNVTQSGTYTAKYTKLAIYNVTTTIEGGGTAESGSVYQGGSVTLKAYPDQHYTFEGWYENGSLVCETLVYTVENIQSHKALVAKFTSISHFEEHTDHSDWTEWSNPSSLPTESGNYYLTTDITLGDSWTTPANVNLCLNGHVINNTVTKALITTSTGAVLNIFDCNDSATHYFDVDFETGRWLLNDSNTQAVRSVNGGVLTSNSGAIKIKSYSCVSLYGGNIIGCNSSAVYIDSDQSRFNMYSGTIQGNYVYSYYGGAAIYIGEYSRTNIYGDSLIAYNHAIYDSGEPYSGGIYIYDVDDTSCGLAVGDTVRIINNRANGYMKNIQFQWNGSITIGRPLYGDALIGVYGDYITYEADADYSQYFVHDNPLYKILANSSSNNLYASNLSGGYTMKVRTIAGGIAKVNGDSRGDGYIPAGTSATLVARPEKFAGFDGWYDKTGKTKVSDSTILEVEKMTASTIYTAVFIENAAEFEILTFSETGGSVSGGGMIAKGETATLIATPSAGYAFDGWYDDENELVCSDAQYVINDVQQYMILTAKFVEDSVFSDDEIIAVEAAGTYQLFNSGENTASPTEVYYNTAPSTLTNNGQYLYYSEYDCAVEGPVGMPFVINGKVLEKSTVTVNSYDVDEGDGEVDAIYLYDIPTGTKTEIGTLTGQNATWNTTSFDIDPELFTNEHTYQLYAHISGGNWEAWIDTASITVGAMEEAEEKEELIKEASVDASIDADGTVTATLNVTSSEDKTVDVEFKATHNETNNQLGGLFDTISVTTTGASDTYSFELEAGAPEGAYRIDVFLKDTQTGDVLKTASSTAGYAYSAVTYNSNGGTNNLPVDSTAYTSGDTVTVKFDYVPSKAGYTFSGWATASDAVAAQYTQNGTKTFNIGSDDVTLYAVWTTEVYYTVTAFAANGGSVSGGGRVKEGESTTLSATPDEGYTFAGWYDGDVKVSDELTYVVQNVTAHKTYTAEFEKEVVVPDYVAYDNQGNTYDSLSEAVLGAVNGSVITLAKDDTAEQQITITKSLTIDLDGHNLPSTVFAITAGNVNIRDSKGTGVINKNGVAGYNVGALGLDTGFNLDHRVSATIIVTGTAKVSINNVTVNSDSIGGNDLTKAIFLGGSEANGTSLVLNHATLNGSTIAGSDALFYYNNEGSSLYMESVVANDCISVNQTPDTTKFVISSADIDSHGGAFWIETRATGDDIAGYITTQEDAEKFLAEGSYFVIAEGESFDHMHVVVASDLGLSDGYTEPEYGSPNEDAPAKVVIPEEGNEVVIGPQIVGGKGEYLYQWYKDDVEIPGATQPTLSVTEPGRYKVVVTDSLTGETIYVYWLIVEEQITHDVTAIALPGGTASVSESSVKHGKATVLTATVNDGYTFDGWYDGDVKISEVLTYSVIITENKTFTAKFISDTVYYTITAFAATGGTVSGGGQIEEGKSITLTAAVNDGYEFDGWYEGENLVCDTLEFVVENVMSDKTYTVKFTLIPVEEPDPTYYTVTASAGIGGTVSGGGQVEEGKSITLKATVNDGYEFDGWYEGENLVCDTLEFAVENVTANKVYTAKFTKLTVYYTVTAEAGAGGAVSGGGQEVEEGTKVTLTATADEGYIFKGWYDGATLVSSKEIYVVTVKETKTYTAKFAEKTTPAYSVWVLKTVGGTVSGGGTVLEGENVTIYATPASGFDFEGWYIGNTKVSNSETYEVTNVTRSTVYTAKFVTEPVPYIEPSIAIRNGVVELTDPQNKFQRLGIFYVGEQTFANPESSWDEMVSAGKQYTEINGKNGYKTYTDVNVIPELTTQGNYVAYMKYTKENGKTGTSYMSYSHELDADTPDIIVSGGSLVLATKGKDVTKLCIAYVGASAPAAPIVTWGAFDKAGKAYKTINGTLGYNQYSAAIGNSTLEDGSFFPQMYTGGYAVYIRYTEDGKNVVVYRTVIVDEVNVNYPIVSAKDGIISFNANGNEITRVSLAYIGTQNKDIYNWQSFYEAGMKYTDINGQYGCNHYNNIDEEKSWAVQHAGYYAMYVKSPDLGSVIYPVVYVDGPAQFPEYSVDQGQICLAANGHEISRISIAYVGQENNVNIYDWNTFSIAGSSYPDVNGAYGCTHYSNNLTDGRSFNVPKDGYYAIYTKSVTVGTATYNTVYVEIPEVVDNAPQIMAVDGGIQLTANGFDVLKVSLAYIGAEEKIISTWGEFANAGNAYPEENGVYGCHHYTNPVDEAVWSRTATGYYAAYIRYIAENGETTVIYDVVQLA